MLSHPFFVRMSSIWKSVCISYHQAPHVSITRTIVMTCLAFMVARVSTWSGHSCVNARLVSVVPSVKGTSMSASRTHAPSRGAVNAYRDSITTHAFAKLVTQVGLHLPPHFDSSIKILKENSSFAFCHHVHGLITALPKPAKTMMAVLSHA